MVGLRSNKFTLALLVLAVGACAQSPSAPPLSCPNNSAAGGYNNIPVNTDVQQLGVVAWDEIIEANATAVPVGCLNVTDAVVDVSSACSQVVAGTNYILTMRVALPSCRLLNNNIVVNLFVPLPNSNELPAINNLAVGTWTSLPQPGPISAPSPSAAKAPSPAAKAPSPSAAPTPLSPVPSPKVAPTPVPTPSPAVVPSPSAVPAPAPVVPSPAPVVPSPAPVVPSPSVAPAPAPAVPSPSPSGGGSGAPLVCPRAGTQQLAGGYTNVTGEENIKLASAMGPLAWSAIVAADGANIPPGCLDDPTKAEVTVTSACSQVVAGTNYILNMVVRLPGCKLVNNNVVANIFKPLPNSNQLPTLNNYFVGPWTAEPPASPTPLSPSPAPSSPAPDNTKLLVCPASNGAPGGFTQATNVSDPQLKALASASWTLITIQNATGLPTDKGCDPSTPVINVTQACSQVVSGTLYIITYNVKLRSCNLETNVTVNMLVPPRTTDNAGPVLNAYVVGNWTALPLPSPSPAVPSPSPAVPSPSPKPPPPCPLGQQPFCRVFVQSTVCCEQQGIVTSVPYANLLLVCSANVRLPQPKCLRVTGPVNVTTSVTSWGGLAQFGDQATYRVDWRNTSFAPGSRTPFNGSVVFDYQALRGFDSECDLQLAETCLVGGTVFGNAAVVNTTQVNVYNTPGGLYSLLSNSTQLPLLSGVAWANSTLGANGCLMQPDATLPSTFFTDKGAITYTNGTRAQCSTAVGQTCTVLP